MLVLMPLSSADVRSEWNVRSPSETGPIRRPRPPFSYVLPVIDLSVSCRTQAGAVIAAPSRPLWAFFVAGANRFRVCGPLRVRGQAKVLAQAH